MRIVRPSNRVSVGAVIVRRDSFDLTISKGSYRILAARTYMSQHTHERMHDKQSSYSAHLNVTKEEEIEVNQYSLINTRPI